MWRCRQIGRGLIPGNAAPRVINPDEISFKRRKNKDSNAIAFSDSRIGR